MLSVVVPIYNTEKYISLAVDSLLNDPVENLEIILVDDASTDNSLEVIRSKYGRHPNVKIIALEANTPGGAGAPSNIGLEHVTQKYTAFLDSDDWIVRGYFSQLLSKIEKFDADVIIGNYRNIDAQSYRIFPPYDSDVRCLNIFNGRMLSKSERHFALALSPEPWRKIYRTSFLKKNKLKFPVTGRVNEDLPFHWHVTLKCSKIYLADPAIDGYFHRISRAGQTTEKNDKSKFTFIDNFNDIIENVNDMGNARDKSMLTYWLIRHSWSIVDFLDKDMQSEYFAKYKDLINKVPASSSFAIDVLPNAALRRYSYLIECSTIDEFLTELENEKSSKKIRMTKELRDSKKSNLDKYSKKSSVSAQNSAVKLLKSINRARIAHFFNLVRTRGFLQAIRKVIDFIE